jgi:hypothetical protein
MQNLGRCIALTVMVLGFAGFTAEAPVVDAPGSKIHEPMWLVGITEWLADLIPNWGQDSDDSKLSTGGGANCDSGSSCQPNVKQNNSDEGPGTDPFG